MTKARRLAAAGFLMASAPVSALQMLDDDQLAGVAGRDGLLVTFSTSSLSADQAIFEMDAGVTDPGVGALGASLVLDDITVTGVGAGGLSPGGTASISAAIDAYTTPGGTPGMGVSLGWNRTRTRIDAIGHGALPGSSIGSVAMDSSGSFALYGANGLLDHTNPNSAARLTLNQGNFFYRQGNNEFVWNNVEASIGFDAGRIGVAPTGLVLQAARMDWNLLFDFGYRKDAVTPFTLGTPGGPDEYIPMLRYGWAGGLTDFRADIRPGGLWYGADASTRTQGINIGWRNNFDTDFVWIIGIAGGNEAQVRFGNWRNLPGAQFAWEVSSITFDMVNAGQGPRPFLYKGQPVSVDATGPAIALSGRDMKFLAYNTTVNIIDNPDPIRSYNWGLVYTVGRLDADILVYPGARGGGEGLTFDALIGLQSPGAWNANSHFMLADTDAEVAVGFINTSFLIDIRDASLELTGGPNGGLRLHSLGGVSWSLDALFGGGELNDLSEPVKFADISLVLEAETLDLRLIPPPSASETYLGFEYDMRLTDTSKITIAEPSRPDVRFTIGGISGDVGARNGRIQLVSGQDNLDGQPRLKFEQDLVFGLTAGTQPLLIQEFAIGPRFIGEMAIPGGRWRGELALKEQIIP